MRFGWVFALVLFLVPAAAWAGHTVTDETARDDARRRDVPLRIYAPDPLEASHGVVLVSHGLGGSRENMPYFGRALAEAGFVAVHMQHIGSDESIWKGKTGAALMRAFRSAARDAEAARLRFGDPAFVLGWLEALPTEHPLAGRLDLGRVGMAGHSYGAISTQVAAGQEIGGTAAFKLPALRAGFLMSPSLPRRTTDLDAAYAKVDIPLFHATGTEDDMPVGAPRDFTPEDRTKPYAALNIPDQYLLVFDGLVHSDFSGQTRGTEEREERETRYTDATARAALLFFGAYLNGDAADKAELRGAFAKSLDPADRFEWK